MHHLQLRLSGHHQALRSSCRYADHGAWLFISLTYFHTHTQTQSPLALLYQALQVLEKLKTERDIKIIFTTSSILLSIYGLKVTYSRRLRKKGEENTIKYLLWLILLNKKEKKKYSFLRKE